MSNTQILGVSGPEEIIKVPIIIDGASIEGGEVEKFNHLKYTTTVPVHTPCIVYSG